MKTKTQIERDRYHRYRKLIEGAVGIISDFRVEDTAIWFRPNNTITIQMLTELSEALGTDRINISCGEEGIQGYSELTPGTSDQMGFIQVLLPVKMLE